MAQEAHFSTYPLRREERIWGFVDLTWIMTGLAIATWAFMIAGTSVLFVGFKAGIAACMMGNLIACAFVGFSCLGTCKYGTEHFTFVRSVFGQHGVKPLIYLILFGINVGWTAVLAIMFGRAVGNVISQLAGIDLNPNGALVIGMALFSLVLAWVILWKGPLAIKWFNRIVAPGLIIVILGMYFLIGTNFSITELIGMPPLEPLEGKLLNFMLVLELNFGSSFAWWPGIGSMSRMARSQRGAVWAYILGLFVPTALAQSVGIMAALAVGDSDPTVWMVPLGGVGLGVLALVWIALANLTSNVSLGYMTLVALRQESMKFLKDMPWTRISAVFYGLAGVLCLWPGMIYDQFFRFLLYCALAYVPFVAISIVDYLFLRGCQVSMRGLYESSPGSPYRYWGGWNWVALVSVAIGIGVYFVMIDPNAFVPHAGFQYLTASMPTLFASGAAYALLTVFVTRRVGKGGFDATTRLKPLKA